MSGSSQRLQLVPGEVDLATLRAIYQGNVTLSLDQQARQAIAVAQQTVEAIVASGKVVYGINTGFGKLAQTQIPAGRLAVARRRPRRTAAGQRDPAGGRHQNYQPGARPLRRAYRTGRGAAGAV